jgi:hypothetical protein
MKQQLSTLRVGAKFYFERNQMSPCVVTFNNGRKFKYIGVPKDNVGDIDLKETEYNTMPSICEGNLVTVIATS